MPVVYLDFELRKEYIIQNLCENRFKPQMNCNGHCYLAKKLQKVAEDNATKETQKQGQSLKKILEEVFDAEPLFSLEWAYVPLATKSIYTFLAAVLSKYCYFSFSSSDYLIVSFFWFVHKVSTKTTVFV